MDSGELSRRIREAPFGCLYCEKVYPTYPEVDAHIDAMHPEDMETRRRQGRL